MNTYDVKETIKNLGDILVEVSEGLRKAEQVKSVERCLRALKAHLDVNLIPFDFGSAQAKTYWKTLIEQALETYNKRGPL